MDGGRLALQNSTSSGTATWECGGVSNDAGSAARVGSTIVARNATYSSRPPDVRGAFASPGYNLIGVGFGATGFNGPGGAAAAGAFDQRGPGFARVVGGRIDIGAFEVQPAPTVSSVVVNNGAAQRSLVTTLTVTFDSVVTILPGAFTLPRVGLPDGGAGAGATVGAIAVDAQTVNGATVATLTFSGANVTAGSLDDGNWTLTIDHTEVLSAAIGTTPAADFSQPGIRRPFGDATGDGRVDNADFFLFRSTFGLRSGQAGFWADFDYDGNGLIDNADFFQLRKRFGWSVQRPPSPGRRPRCLPASVC